MFINYRDVAEGVVAKLSNKSMLLSFMRPPVRVSGGGRGTRGFSCYEDTARRGEEKKLPQFYCLMESG